MKMGGANGNLNEGWLGQWLKGHGSQFTPSGRSGNHHLWSDLFEAHRSGEKRLYQSSAWWTHVIGIFKQRLIYTNMIGYVCMYECQALSNVWNIYSKNQFKKKIYEWRVWSILSESWHDIIILCKFYLIIKFNVVLELYYVNRHLVYHKN